MTYEIKHRYTNKTLLTVDSDSLCGADLSKADLSKADLSKADLIGANLLMADLHGADLRGADLRWANLRGANLSEANLIGANLLMADLRGANLSEANLSKANLIEANLLMANLRGADLYGADLCGADLCGAVFDSSDTTKLALAKTEIVPREGEVIGWKSANGTIIKLRIPPEAKRSNATGRKCRAEFAEVLAVDNRANRAETSGYGPRTKYEEGKTVHADSWDPDRFNECSHGIHFYLTREEAQAW